jgi:hypothetical protein
MNAGLCMTGSRLRGRGRGRALALLLVFFAVGGCKTQDDAVAAAEQMTSTAKSLAKYYAAIEDAVESTRKLGEIQKVMYGTKMDDAYLAELKDTQAELEKRTDMAKSLGKLAGEFTKLTGAKTSTDAATAAESLGGAMDSLKALPNGPPMADIFSTAAHEIVGAVQQRKEREAAAAMDKTLAAVQVLFANEKPVYESLYRNELVLASSIAKELIKKNQVDTSGLLASAMQPFGLTPDVKDATLIASLNEYAAVEVESERMAKADAQAKATDAMDKALQEMSKRVHELATSKVINPRGDPPTLKDVEKWLLTLPGAVSGTHGAKGGSD